MHKGKIIAQKGKNKIIDCEKCKFKHLYPLPSERELKEFYQKRYFGIIKKRKYSPLIKRLTKNKKALLSEQNWLGKTLYNDIHFISKIHMHKPGSLIDIGCGTGDFLRYMKKTGWNVVGIEPSGEMAGTRRRLSFMIYRSLLEGFINSHPQYKNTFDVATILHVLEHVPDPRRFLKDAKKFLKPRTGMVCIYVPNDFSPLQGCVQRKINKKLWWMAAPDHINYFDRQSLEKLLRSAGFEITYTTSDFPMELFLLMGDDYITHPAAGKKCHKKRVDFELSLPEDLRRTMYRCLAGLNIGRNLIVFAKVKG